jgi:predicted RNA-binding protein YlxR (DUF448 family)
MNIRAYVLCDVCESEDETWRLATVPELELEPHLASSTPRSIWSCEQRQDTDIPTFLGVFAQIE